uniref:PARP-type domain-containing protein n=1 Tax=Aegilops tauschii subsp. strangulata TaxID=200361 RepID=A0A453FG67_AEGTS
KAEVAEKGSVSVEYAKSARSTCKACNASITKGALRIGVSAHDPRGFDSTKWYHVACFPTSSHPLGRVEKLKGFDSIKVCALGGFISLLFSSVLYFSLVAKLLLLASRMTIVRSYGS